MQFEICDAHAPAASKKRKQNQTDLQLKGNKEQLLFAHSIL